MTHIFQKKFFDVLKNIFIGARIEGDSGYVNLMRVKSRYYKEFESGLQALIYQKLSEVGRDFEEELYNKLYTFFKKYFSETGSIYFAYTPVHEKVYERIYRDDKDVMLFWKTHNLYYIKTERLFKNLEVEDEGIVYFFDVAELPLKQSNEKKDIVFELVKAEFNTDTFKRWVHFAVKYSDNGKVTKIDDIHKNIKKADKSFNNIQTEQLERAFSIFKKQNEVDFFINKNAKAFLSEQLSFWLKTYVLDDASVFDAQRLKQIKALKDISSRIIDIVAQFEDELVKIWNKPKFVRRSNYVITLDKIAAKNADILRGVLAHPNLEKQVAEWQQLGIIKADFDPSQILIADALNPTWQFLPLDTQYFKALEINILSLFDNLDAALDGWLIHSENYQATNNLLRKFRNKIKCVHIDPPYNTETSGFLYVNTYKSSSWLTMMENRIRIAYDFLTKDGSFLCHIDENEYERLSILCDYLNIPDAGTVIWDKRNPMNAGMGIATQHEYIIWRTKQETPIYLKNDTIILILEKAKEFIEKNKSNIGKAQKEFAQWVKNNEDLSGGEKAYSSLSENGNIYQSVSLRAPEYRNDPKFHQPLIHPKTLKPCPIPPNGFSRTPETLRTMVERGEILFGDDETTQPRQKVYLTENSKRQISSVIQDAKKGKADLDILGLDFPYCHPVSLYKKLLGAVCSGSEDIVLDFFGGSGTSAQATIELNKEDKKKRKYILVELGEHYFTTIIPRMKKLSFTDKWKDGQAQEGTGYSHFFKYYALEQYEEVLRKAQYADKAHLERQDIFNQYLFLKDVKLGDVLNADEATETIKVDVAQLYPDIDMAETLSHLYGKFIKRVTAESVEFDDGTLVDLKNLYYKMVKPLIWW